MSAKPGTTRFVDINPNAMDPTTVGNRTFYPSQPDKPGVLNYYVMDEDFVNQPVVMKQNTLVTSSVKPQASAKPTVLGSTVEKPVVPQIPEAPSLAEPTAGPTPKPFKAPSVFGVTGTLLTLMSDTPAREDPRAHFFDQPEVILEVLSHFAGLDITYGDLRYLPQTADMADVVTKVDSATGREEHIWKGSTWLHSLAHALPHTRFAAWRR